MWVVVLAQSGVATSTGAYSTEKKQSFKPKKTRKTMHPNNDDIAVFQVVQDAVPIDNRIL